jgi:hypothetical protein
MTKDDDVAKATMKALTEAMAASKAAVASSQPEDIERELEAQEQNEDDGLILLAIGIIKNVMYTLFKIGVKRLDKTVSTVIDYTTNGALNVPIEELPVETKGRVIALAAYLKLMAEDPEFVEAIRDLTRIASLTGTNVVDVARPYILKIVKKMADTSEKVVSEATTGAMRSLISFASAVISAIPFVGGFINLFISAGITFNSIMNVFKKFTQGNARAVDIATSGIKRTLDVNMANIQASKDAFKRAFSPRKNIKPVEPSAPPLPSEEEFENIPASKPSVKPSVMQKLKSRFSRSKIPKKEELASQVGGAKTRIMRAKRNIHKTTDRLNKTLKRFKGGGTF